VGGVAFHGACGRGRAAGREALWGEHQLRFYFEHKRRFLRVQVKATRSKQCNSYYCHVRRSHRAAYTREHIDFIAAYLVPRDIWYIIPLEIAGTDMIVLSPDLATSKHAAYKEAWHLLRGD